MRNCNSHNTQDWGAFSNTPKEIIFDEVFGDAKKCGIRFNCVKQTIPKNWQCKGVGQKWGNLDIPTEIKDFLIDVKSTTTTSTTTTATTTQGLKPHSNCTEKSVSFTDSSAKQMKTNKIAIISLSATCGILLVVVVITTICCTRKRLCKKQKVTINEPKKEKRNSTWYNDYDISTASRASSTCDIEQPPFEYKSVIVME